VSDRTPVNVADLLARSWQMFVDGYYTYENFMDAGTRSLQAVEAALRVRFEAGNGTTFFELIERAKTEGLVSNEGNEILHVGRRLRNSQVHATSLPVITPAMAAELGTGALERCWQQVTGAPLPPAVRRHADGERGLSDPAGARIASRHELEGGRPQVAAWTCSVSAFSCSEIEWISSVRSVFLRSKSA